MRTQHQLIVDHNESAESYGDCFRTCVACILDLPACDVPHRYPDRVAWERANAEPYSEFLPGDPIIDFLAAKGLRLLTVRYSGEWPLERVLREVGYYNPGAHWILGGTSASGHGHVVVCRGAEVVWDVHPRGSGLAGPDDEGGQWPVWFAYFIGANN